MRDLTGSVGVGSAHNRIHDVALIQAMLCVARKPESGRAFSSRPWDGRFDALTGRTIEDFQEAIGISEAGSEPDRRGRIEPGGPTFLELKRAVTRQGADYARLRALPGSAMIYLEATSEELAAKLDGIRESELEDGFKSKVLELAALTYEKLGLALGGWGEMSYRRSFAEQFKVCSEGYSRAGPGESSHQFGRAVDIGFGGLRYLRPDGTIGAIADEHSFDGDLDPAQREALYGARNRIWERPPYGEGALFRIRFHDQNGRPIVDADPSHFQGFNQFESLYPGVPVVSMRRSLAEHLSLVSSMRWEATPGGYACDLGLGGEPIDVGSAAEIWSGRSTLSRDRFVVALAARGAGTEADFEAARFSLKRAFEAAERCWREWVPRSADGAQFPSIC